MQAFYYPMMMLAAVIMIYAAYNSQKGSFPKNAAFSLGNMRSVNTGSVNIGSGNANSGNISSSKILVAAACFSLVVYLRSFVGLALEFPWRGLGNWGVALICAVVFGKVAGGFAADKLGVIKTSILSLGSAALLFLLFQTPVAGVAALLLFNMTMPVTLWAMSKLFPGAKGFAFGLLTFALFLGFLPIYLGVDISAYAPWLFAALSAVSLGILFFGLRKSDAKA